MRRGSTEAREEAIGTRRAGRGTEDRGAPPGAAAVAAAPAARSVPSSIAGLPASEASPVASPTASPPHPATARCGSTASLSAPRPATRTSRCGSPTSRSSASPASPSSCSAVLAAYAWHSRGHAYARPQADRRAVAPGDRLRYGAVRGQELAQPYAPHAAARPRRDRPTRGSRAAAVRGYTFVPLARCARRSLTRRAPCRTAPTSMPSGCPTTAAGCSRIRRERERVATLEIGPHSREAGMLAITQLKGAPQHGRRRSMCGRPRMHGSRRRAACGGCRRASRPSGGSTRTPGASSWAPIGAGRAARRGWRRPQRRGSFDAFNGEMADLARRGGVSSWLFTESHVVG